MARYRQKPEHVDARQFTGGRENAEEVLLWLRSKGCEASWVDNQTVLDIHLVERLQFKTPESKNIIRSAYRKDWIVLKDSNWRIFSEKSFRERFEKI
ncbi:hypothetical protein CAPNMURICA_59 [Arthrobacter phage CapnMurica]|uniref:Uncharacterized protein n=2 Tax=Gordonvirus captnmurica TaxID=1982153 RepID=A0A386KS28_9CAUD|nr:hypothetical protein FDH68_gp59 [Arthrobacter phage CaptnMurica]ALY08659.1 hypothetical protein CAPNMURICA_59 [Arthrobacter phage CaptnMurica]AYD87271.1 hypothetical protein SEA_TENNO_62 [Arthrobacter phage Tenno]